MFRAIIIVSVLLGFCPIYGQNLPNGIVVDTVRCEQNKKQSYALYLPSYYSPEEKWSSIIFFEPAARGALPVNKYKSIAEELGIILVSSNNSKNGSWDVVMDASEAIFSDIRARFNIDSDRIVLSGFSGGSRAATALAVLNPSILGVIGCGGGLSAKQAYLPTRASKFKYAGIVGDRDMNYLEHAELVGHLDSLGIHNILLNFSGPHVWPPKNKFRQAVLWMHSHANEKPGSSSLSTLVDEMRTEGDSLFKSGQLLAAEHIYKQAIDEFQHAVDCSALEESLADVHSHKKIKRLRKKQLRFAKIENNYYDMLLLSFGEMYRTRLKPTRDTTVKTKDWWHRGVDSLKYVEGLKDLDKSRMASRCLYRMTAEFSMATDRFYELGDYETAIVFNEMWNYSQSSAWSNWSMAKCQVASGNHQSAVEYLWAAQNLGMTKVRSLEIEEFKVLEKNNAFQELKALLLKNQPEINVKN